MYHEEIATKEVIIIYHQPMFLQFTSIYILYYFHMIKDKLTSNMRSKKRRWGGGKEEGERERKRSFKTMLQIGTIQHCLSTFFSPFLIINLIHGAYFELNPTKWKTFCKTLNYLSRIIKWKKK